jgi:hypothetical protein
VARRSAVRLSFVVGLLTLAVVAIGAPAASAKRSLLGLSNDCGQASQPFAQFGDYRSYTFGANGGLENGSTGWSLSGPAHVVHGNESYFVHNRHDASSLALSTGSVVLTPRLCMGTTSTWLRFFVRSSDGGSVRVQVVLRNLAGQILGIVQISDLAPGTSWEPGPAILNLDSLLGVVGVSSIQLKFTGLGGTVQIDDLYVDPWASRN